MALSPLATTADLPASVDTSDATLVAQMLDAASAEVREAAGCAISQETSTVSIGGTSSRWLTLPGGPVTAVSSVEVDGVAVTDWKLVDGRLWRACGWQGCEPSIVTVAMTHGFADVPADIVLLTAQLAAAGINAGLTEFAARSGIQSEQESIDDYSSSKTYVTGVGASATVMELPERTRLRLRSRFGGGAYVTGSDE